jgi:hypothetical protein
LAVRSASPNRFGLNVPRMLFWASFRRAEVSWAGIGFKPIGIIERFKSTASALQKKNNEAKRCERTDRPSIDPPMRPPPRSIHCRPPMRPPPRSIHLPCADAEGDERGSQDSGSPTRRHTCALERAFDPDRPCTCSRNLSPDATGNGR